MATKKKMLQAAAGNATGGAGGEPGLNVEDVFSTYLYEGNGSSQIIHNGINLGQSLGSGSAKFDGTSGMSATTTPYLLGSNFTIEAFVYLDALTSNYQDIFTFKSPSASLLVNTTNQLEFYPTAAKATSTFPVGQWVHVAVSKSGSTLKLFQDGAEVASVANSTAYSTTTGIFIGSWDSVTSEEWAGNISNLRVSNIARYTSAFTAPTSNLSNDSNTTLYLFNEDKSYDDLSSSGLTFTNTSGVETVNFGPFDGDDAGEGGMVWVKSRDLSYDNYIMDTERGVLKYLKANGTSQQASSSNAISAFNANGFTVGGGGQLNNSGDSLASWTFRKAPKFFTCLTYSGTGPGSGANEQQVSHDLGAKPGIVIIKRTDASGDWWVFTDVIDGSNDYGYLNQGAAFGNSANNVATDSVFNVGGSLNTSGATYAAYLFASNDGDGEFGPDGDLDAIKCGSYTGNGTVGQEIDLGFEPQFVMAKITSTTGNWYIQDAMRTMIGNGSPTLKPNSTDAEYNSNGYTEGNIELTSTGFKLDTNDHGGGNGNGATYIYIAIRRGTKVPESATEVFAPALTNNGPEPSYTTGFVTDFGLQKLQSGSATYSFSRITGDGYMITNGPDAENSGSNVVWDYMDGFGDSSANTYKAWFWKRAPGYFDAVAYSGDGVAGRTVSHNLGVAPEMMWVKSRTENKNWIVYHKDLTDNTKYMDLNNTGAEKTAATAWNSTSPTETVFTVGTATSVNNSSQDYISYLFSSLDGISKVGSFSHTVNTATNVDCGFTSGARFVLVKQSDGSGNWWVWDTERGIVAGNDNRLALNTTGAENTGNDDIDPYSAGFTWAATWSSGNYIFYAIA